jgi:serine phosphatase RsbU (regulator of sigma subunit)
MLRLVVGNGSWHVMSERTRQFIIRTLAIHAILLGVVLAVVLSASHSIYASTDKRELDEATQQQERLAQITGRGIETFYSDIWADLDVLLRQASPTSAPTTTMLSPGRGPGGEPGDMGGGPPMGDRGEGGGMPPGGFGAGGGNPPPGGFPGGFQPGGPQPGGSQPGGPQPGRASRGGRGGGTRGRGSAAFGAGPVNLNPQQQESMLQMQLGRQLQNRVKLLFVLDFVPTGNPTQPTALAPQIQIWSNQDNAANRAAALDLAQQDRDLLTAVSVATISPVVSTKYGLANLICIPLSELPGPGGRPPAARPPATRPAATSPAPGRRWLVAVILVDQIGNQFTPENREYQDTTSILVDQADRVVASSAKLPEGTELKQSSDPVLSGLRTAVADTDAPSYVTDGTLVTIVPVDVQPSVTGAVYWSLVMRTPLADIDADVNLLFQRTVYWGVFVVVAVTAILVSTAVQLIQSRSRMEHMQNELLTRELDQAREIQLKWLPPVSSTPAGLELHAVNHPASHISGDFYNWFDLPDGRTVVAIGDVTGHGMAAAFLMATTQLLVRNTMARVADPGKCLQDVNNQLCVQVFHGQFVSLLLMVLDLKQGIVEIADAGHPAPVLVYDGKCEAMEGVKSQLVLGVEQNVEYPTQRLPLPPGAGLLLYTDGVVEALSPTGQRYLLSGLKQALSTAQPGARGMIDAVVAGVKHHLAGNPLADDLTMVAIQLH